MAKLRIKTRPVQVEVKIERRGNAWYRITKIRDGSSVRTKTERIA